ncbi:hypothetical protein CHU98_g5632 [Xylaria longipes]|nr:hypothetical protein CHU98_g5632 [Xylaria longipes]
MSLKTRTKLDVGVERPTPYTFDLGLLLANDANPINTSTPAETSSMGVDPLEARLIATARDGAQGIINQLLTTCPISSTPQGVLLSLPAPSTALPREKPLPPPKAHEVGAVRREAGHQAEDARAAPDEVAEVQRGDRRVGEDVGFQQGRPHRPEREGRGAEGLAGRGGRGEGARGEGGEEETKERQGQEEMRTPQRRKQVMMMTPSAKERGREHSPISPGIVEDAQKATISREENLRASNSKWSGVKGSGVYEGSSTH